MEIAAAIELKVADFVHAPAVVSDLHDAKALVPHAHHGHGMEA